MKVSPNKFAQYRTGAHYDPHIDEFEEEFWPMMGILFAILAIWTGVVHFIDWLTFDVIPWWIEPFTIVPFLFLMAMNEKFDSLNPLHWWPMVWGYEAKLPEKDRITIRPLDNERIIEQHGGKMNVYIVDYEHIKFRKRKDAVMFGLRYF